MSASASHDVVVIGAGLAGLAAALELEAQGFDVLVLEAQERTGGRIHSMRQLGENAEAGGTFIGAGYERVIDAAARHGVPLVDVTPILEFFREQDLCLDGRLIRQADWPEDPANPFPAADKHLFPWNYHRVLTMRENPLGAPGEWLAPEQSAHDIPMRRWLAGLGLDEAAIRLAYGVNPSFGADADDVSALMLLFRAAFSKAQRTHAPEGQVGFTAERGVQRIPDAMAAALKRGVELGREVIGIACGENGAGGGGDRGGEVHLADGGRIAARHIVCSVPAGALRRIAIDPPLIGRQARAVAELPAQPVTQVYLAVKSAFWENDGFAPSLFTDTGAGMVAAVRSASDPTRITHLTAWVMGPHAGALDALPPADAARRVIEAIEAIRPAARGQLECLGVQSWGADVYAAGAWAYFRPGQVHAFLPDMAAPHGRLHFCGEHLALEARGMEGAMETGERAAAQVLERR